MNKIWYNVYSYPTYPPTIYGFATDEKGVVVTANERVNWMVGRKIEDIKKFFEGKPAELVCINDLIKIKTTEQ